MPVRFQKSASVLFNLDRQIILGLGRDLEKHANAFQNRVEAAAYDLDDEQRQTKLPLRRIL